ncbi:hypothetical protein CDIK_3766, partial [Cucumispora dikerogammari]
MNFSEISRFFNLKYNKPNKTNSTETLLRLTFSHAEILHEGMNKQKGLNVLLEDLQIPSGTNWYCFLFDNTQDLKIDEKYQGAIIGKTMEEILRIRYYSNAKEENRVFELSQKRKKEKNKETIKDETVLIVKHYIEQDKKKRYIVVLIEHRWLNYQHDIFQMKQEIGFFVEVILKANNIILKTPIILVHGKKENKPELPRVKEKNLAADSQEVEDTRNVPNESVSVVKQEPDISSYVTPGGDSVSETDSQNNNSNIKKKKTFGIPFSSQMNGGHAGSLNTHGKQILNVSTKSNQDLIMNSGLAEVKTKRFSEDTSLKQSQNLPLNKPTFQEQKNDVLIENSDQTLQNISNGTDTGAEEQKNDVFIETPVQLSQKISKGDNTSLGEEKFLQNVSQNEEKKTDIPTENISEIPEVIKKRSFLRTWVL